MWGKQNKKSNTARDKPKKSTVGWLCSNSGYDTLCIPGYTRFLDCPEVQMAINKIADLVSSMTIYLMENTDDGDVRIVNDLSRKIDINPNRHMTRKTFISCVVRTLLGEGDGNAVILPKTRGGYLDDLIPLPPSQVTFQESGDSYVIQYSGKAYNPDELIHICINPSPENPFWGQGYRVALKDVAQSLKQATATKKGFMADKWKPSLIVKVEATADEFSNKEARRKFADEYLSTQEAGEPWIIPSDLLAIEQVKPLSLNDLAINDAVTLDKKTVAAILDVPSFVVGAGSYNKDEYNNLISTKILSIARAIEQEFTKKLLSSRHWYFRFNPRALYAYNINELASVGKEMFVRGIMTGNEVRDWIGLSPKPGLSQLTILENYIPLDKIANQSKLMGGDENGSENETI
ncbi:phage portal protein [Solibaculum mannosilyticum]|uniref:Phage portal protein n=1 Tax=Solibaculum mannosilyticum TaxID=2780922 RepID=A0A7I8D4Y2_9FIRM|nr:phage portal protein [Solibaculum mannosilyticum]BCI60842.1 phage portal protein [Solibaculum mannosilyticum]